ncbi:MAG: glycosyltransferase family 2 protein [Pseudomonadota bacterium]
MSVSVSVILPVYNRSHSLPEACRSVLNQSYRDLELIIVDDASTEDLKPVVDALEDDRVRYIRHQRNAGAAAARNTGLAEAKGRMIAFQDSDDLWLPGKLASQVELLESQPAEVGVVTAGKVVYGIDSARVPGPGKATYGPKPESRMKLEDDQVRRSITMNRLSLQNALFRRDCYPDPIWFDPLARANNDWEFSIRLVQHTKILEVVGPVVMGFRSDDSISGDPRKRISGLLRIMRKNRHLEARYPREYRRNFYTLGRAIWKQGKKKTAMRLMLKGLRGDPSLLPYMAKSFLVGGYRRRLKQRRSTGATV